MIEFDDLDDIFGRNDASDRSHDEDEDEDGYAKSRSKHRDDEAEEDNGDQDENENGKPKKKKPAGQKRVVLNRRVRLDADRICGPRGVRALIDTFKEVKLRGKGHEKADLDLVLAKMEHWAHRLFPQLPFDNFLETVERVGHKKPVQTYMKKIRMDLIDTDGDHREETEEAPEREAPAGDEPPADAFDDLLARYSRPSASPSLNLTVDQQERMAENRRRAEEKRKSRLLADASAGAGQAPAAPEDLVDIDSMLADMAED